MFLRKFYGLFKNDIAPIQRPMCNYDTDTALPGQLHAQIPEQTIVHQSE